MKTLALTIVLALLTACAYLPGKSPAVAPRSTTQAIHLTWTAPTQREDGTALAPEEIRNYEVYYATDEAMSDERFLTEVGTEGTQELSVGPGHHCYTLRTVTTEEPYNVSQPSAVACVTVEAGPPSKPNPPTELYINIVTPPAR